MQRSSAFKKEKRSYEQSDGSPRADGLLNSDTFAFYGNASLGGGAAKDRSNGSNPSQTMNFGGFEGTKGSSGLSQYMKQSRSKDYGG